MGCAGEQQHCCCWGSSWGAVLPRTSTTSMLCEGCVGWGTEQQQRLLLLGQFCGAYDEHYKHTM